MAEPLYRCLTKGTTAEQGDIRRSLSWVLSRRAYLEIDAEQLQCGDWVIPYSTIDDAVLYRAKKLPWGAFYVLRLKTNNRVYQFGLRDNKFWQGELPFPVTRQAGRLGYSWFSIAVRVTLVAALAYQLRIWMP